MSFIFGASFRTVKGLHPQPNDVNGVVTRLEPGLTAMVAHEPTVTFLSKLFGHLPLFMAIDYTHTAPGFPGPRTAACRQPPPVRPALVILTSLSVLPLLLASCHRSVIHTVYSQHDQQAHVMSS